MASRLARVGIFQSLHLDRRRGDHPAGGCAVLSKSSRRNRRGTRRVAGYVWARTGPNGAADKDRPLRCCHRRHAVLRDTADQRTLSRQQPRLFHALFLLLSDRGRAGRVVAERRLVPLLLFQRRRTVLPRDAADRSACAATCDLLLLFGIVARALSPAST